MQLIAFPARGIDLTWGIPDPVRAYVGAFLAAQFRARHCLEPQVTWVQENYEPAIRLTAISPAGHSVERVYLYSHLDIPPMPDCYMEG